MRKLGHIWSVVTNLFALVLVLAMFGTASTPFETVVVSGMTLIYVSVVSFSTFLGRNQLELAQGMAAELLVIRRLLNDARADHYESELDEAKAHYRKTTVRFYINSSFTFVIWLVAVIYLIGAAL